jgi:hypothetical protein
MNNRFPGLRRLADYREELLEEVNSGFISYSLFLRRMHKAHAEFRRELDAAGNLEIMQWLGEHQPKSKIRLRADGMAVYVDEEVVAHRKRLVRRALKQSKMTAQEFLAKLIEAYENYTPTTEQQALAKLFVLRWLGSIPKGVTENQ